MPITAEYKWEQTKAAVSLLVPLRGAKPNTSDVFVSAEYVKINSMPYFLELDLRNSIVPSKARAVFEPQVCISFAPMGSLSPPSFLPLELSLPGPATVPAQSGAMQVERLGDRAGEGRASGTARGLD